MKGGGQEGREEGGRRKREEGRKGGREGRGQRNLVTFLQLRRPCLLFRMMKPTRQYKLHTQCLIFRSS